MTASPANTTGTTATVPADPSNSATSNNGENGRISHRASGGPDLNYLYATDHVDPISSYPSTQPEDDATSSSSTSNTKDKKNKNNSNKNKPNKENKNQTNHNPMVTVIEDPTSKKPIQRGRKSDKRSLRGQTLYLGGEEGPNNKIYCIPGHSERVLCIDTKTDDVYPIGPILEGKFKWLRGIVVGTIIYGLPCHADCVLRIDTVNDSVSTIPIPYEEHFENGEGANDDDDLETKAEQERFREWKYHGGSISPHDGCIYAIPQSALRVLRIDPVTEACSFVGPEYEGRCKWYGGVVGNTDGAIYGIPQNAEGVLRIDASGVKYNAPDAISSPESRVLVTTHGSFPLGGHKWHGASASSDGTIVSVPANADTVLCIVPALTSAYPPSDTSALTSSTPSAPEPSIYILHGETPQDISTGRHRTDRKYKYLGAMEGSDGNVYCFPSGSERVLQIDTKRRVARSVGHNLRDMEMERLFQNKWQNGLTTHQEGCVYAIPLAAETVLRVHTGKPSDNPSDVEVSTWKLPEPNKTLAKWEGGVIAENGIMYCMPNNHKAVLQIVPPCVPSRDGLAKERAERELERERARELQRQQELQQEQLEKEEKEQKKKEKKERAEQEKRDVNEGKSEAKGVQSDKSNGNDDTTPDGIPFKYKTGIATLRSSAHRVKYALEHRKHDPNPVGNDGSPTNTTFLPTDLCLENILKYPTDEYDFHGAVVEMLRACDGDLIGTFRSSDEDVDVKEMDDVIKAMSLKDAELDNVNSTSTTPTTSIHTSNPKLEDFVVPLKSLTRKCQKGKIEQAQNYLSEKVAADTHFLSLFDNFLEKVVLPNLKQRLQSAGVKAAHGPLTFYYQRPPTMRIQPGPARALVRAHDDAEYGHQNGELNFWLPLTSRHNTGVDLWCESKSGADDFHPLEVEHGEVVSFHGSSCRHYVNSNHSQRTRVSLDFRVGIEGFYDPFWQMVGTTCDHSRKEITL